MASKRLRAVKEFTEFGSGFKIAMRDLEIRGAGNILGPEQHGHMDSVGYDMYCKILRESVDTIQGKKPEAQRTVTMDIEVNAYLPESYIHNSNQRIDIYKKIAAIETDDDRFEIEDELDDRYGDIPKTVSNIIEVAHLKAKASNLGIIELVQHGVNMTVRFADGYLDINRIMAIEDKYRGRMRLTSQTEPVVSLKLKDGDKNILQIVNDLLNIIPPLDESGHKEYNE